MRVVFRVDSSQCIGSGHLTRCLSLAGELRRWGVKVTFICRVLKGNLSSLVKQQGYEIQFLPPVSDSSKYFDNENTSDNKNPYAKWLEVDWQTDALQTKKILLELGAINWLVKDHYALDCCWESSTRSLVDRIMVIDDLANRHHDCDLLLDQNCYPDLNQRYEGLLPQKCRQLLGYDYLLLRPEFRQCRLTPRTRAGEIKRLLVFFGGSDSSNQTAEVITALNLLDENYEVDVVVGKTNPNREEIELACHNKNNMHFHCQVDNMAEFIAAADLGIGGGGFSAYERAYLGLPSLVTILDESQRQPMLEMLNKGAIELLEGEKTALQYRQALEPYFDGLKPLQSMSQAGLALFDGLGARRVVAAMREGV